MSHEKGAYLGGVRSVSDLRDRCRPDPDTGCWHWGGAINGCGSPVTHLPMAGGTITCKRAAVLLSRGAAALKKGHRVWACCHQRDCCNPQHMRVGTPAQFGSFMHESKRWQGDMKRIATITRTARERSKLSLETVREIRSSGLTAKQVTQKYGLNLSHASYILRGVIWRCPEAIKGASVFSWRPGVVA